MMAVIVILPALRAVTLGILLAWGDYASLAPAVNTLGAIAMSAALIGLGFIGLRRGRTTREACYRPLARDAESYMCAGRGPVQDEELQLIIGLHLRGWTWEEIGTQLGSNADRVEQLFICWNPQNRRIR
jgi:hypothetical protein